MKFLVLVGALVGVGVKQGKLQRLPHIAFSTNIPSKVNSHITTYTLKFDKVHTVSVQETLKNLREKLSQQEGYAFVSEHYQTEGQSVTYTIIERWQSIEREQEIKRLKNVSRNYSALHFLGKSLVVGENKNI